jgi:hypothetical protein
MDSFEAELNDGVGYYDFFSAISEENKLSSNKYYNSKMGFNS